MTFATCHPERVRYLRDGTCRVCANRLRQAEREKAKRPCVLCSRSFVPKRRQNVVCSEACRRLRSTLVRSRRAGRLIDCYEVTRDPDLAARLVRTLRRRGLRLVGPRTARRNVAARGYYTAWKRESLYVVRYWPPFTEEGE